MAITLQERLRNIERQIERLRLYTGVANMGGGAAVGNRPYATKVVAAVDSAASEAANADYVCDGTADEAQINAALTAAAGGLVLLLDGTYTLAADLSVPDSTVLAGLGQTATHLTGAAISNGALIQNVFICDLETSGGIVFATALNVTVRGCAFETAGIVVTDPQNFAVLDCAFTNVGVELGVVA